MVCGVSGLSPSSGKAQGGGYGTSITQIISQSTRLSSTGLENSLCDQGALPPWLSLRVNARLQEEGRGRGEQGLGRHSESVGRRTNFFLRETVTSL